MTRLRLIATMAALPVLTALPALADPQPPALAPAPASAPVTAQFPAFTGDVVDDAHVLSPEAQTVLRQDLAHLNRITGHRLVVATVATLGGRDINAYGADLLKAWQVAGKTGGDGAVLIIAPNEKTEEIATGPGLTGTLSQAMTEVIQRDTVNPYVKAGNIDEAAIEGARDIGQAITPVEAKTVVAPPVAAAVKAPIATKAVPRAKPPAPMWLIMANLGNFGLLGFSIFKLFQAFAAWRRGAKAEAEAPDAPAPVLRLRPQPVPEHGEVMASVQRLIDDEEARDAPAAYAANSGWDEFWAVPQGHVEPEKLPDEDEEEAKEAAPQKVKARARA